MKLKAKKTLTKGPSNKNKNKKNKDWNEKKREILIEGLNWKKNKNFVKWIKIK
jgi:hypothetical protein